MSLAKLIVTILVVSTVLIILFMDRWPRSQQVESSLDTGTQNPVDEKPTPPDVIIPVRINIPFKYGPNTNHTGSTCHLTNFSRIDEVSLSRGVSERFRKGTYDYIHVLWSSIHPQKKEHCWNLTPGNIVVNGIEIRPDFNPGMSRIPPMMTYGPTYVRYRAPTNTDSAVMEFGNREKLKYIVDFKKKSVAAATAETGRIAPPYQFAMKYIDEVTHDIKFQRVFPTMEEYNSRFNSGGCYRFSAYRVSGISVKRFTPKSDSHVKNRIIGYLDEVLVRGKFTKEQKATGKCKSGHVSNFWNWARLLATDGTPHLGSKTHSALTSLEYDEDRRFTLPAGRYKTVALILGAPDSPVAQVKIDLLNGKVLP